jgi:hypothetical protein
VCSFSAVATDRGVIQREGTHYCLLPLRQDREVPIPIQHRGIGVLGRGFEDLRV